MDDIDYPINFTDSIYLHTDCTLDYKYMPYI